MNDLPIKQVSMSRRLAVALVLVMTLLSVLVATGAYLFTSTRLKQTFDSKVEQTLSYLDGTLAPVLWNFDHETAAQVGKAVLRDDLIIGMTILDEKGETILSTQDESDDDALRKVQPIFFQGKVVGELVLLFSRKPLSDTLSAIFLVSFSVWLLAVLSITVITHLFIKKYFRGPLSSFIDLAKSYHDHLESPSSSATQFLEFQPIEEVVKDLANDVFMQLKDIRKSEEKYRRIFENVEDGYILTDMDGTILSVNPATVKILKYDQRNELEGKNIAQALYVDPKQRQELKETLKEKSTLKDQVLEFRSKDNVVVSAECNISLICDEANSPVAIEGTIRDVTKRNQAEKELQKHRENLEALVEARTTELSIANERLKELDKLKSLFIASMSHELRTPLNSIIGFTGLTLGGKLGELNPKHKDFLSRSYKSAKHLLALISDVIDISKIESGIVQAYPELFLLNEILTEVMDFSSSHRKETVELKAIIPEGIEIYSDRQRVLQCILNLLSNALKYTQEGRVHLSAVETDDQIEVRVEDTGIGISEACMEKLFLPFERLDSPMRITEAGTGLGLYLTRKLTSEVLDGSLRVESVLGKGSTFYLTLPKILKPKDPVTQASILEIT